MCSILWSLMESQCICSLLCVYVLWPLPTIFGGFQNGKIVYVVSILLCGIIQVIGDGGSRCNTPAAAGTVWKPHSIDMTHTYIHTYIQSHIHLITICLNKFVGKCFGNLLFKGTLITSIFCTVLFCFLFFFRCVLLKTDYN